LFVLCLQWAWFGTCGKGGKSLGRVSGSADNRRVMKAPAQALTNDSPEPARPSLWLRLASVLIALHLAAVIVAPLSAPPSSPLAGWLAQGFRPYLDAAFLNHGYKFFAPDPGPTHLVRYELELADGTQRKGVFPNLTEQRPRLLYHRHMMLSERLDGPPQFDWVQAYSKSYAQHLLKRHEAKSVTLHLVTHALPYPTQVTGGMKLDDPSLYQERKLLTLSGDAP
jgi:hypothetical protein